MPKSFRVEIHPAPPEDGEEGVPYLVTVRPFGSSRLLGELRVLQEARGVGQAEQLGEMQHAARALLAADHDEVVLVAVQPGHEDHARLVEARRRLEDVAGERDGGCEQLIVFFILVLT